MSFVVLVLGLNVCNATTQHLRNHAKMIYLDLLPVLTSNIHTLFFKTHTEILLTTFLKLPFMDTHRPSPAGVRLPLIQISTHSLHFFLCVCVCVQTDLASSVGVSHTTHNTHRRVPCSTFQPLFSFPTSPLFL